MKKLSTFLIIFIVAFVVFYLLYGNKLAYNYFKAHGMLNFKNKELIPNIIKRKSSFELRLVESIKENNNSAPPGKTIITGSDIKNVEVRFSASNFGEPLVCVQLNDNAKEIFSNVTAENVGKRIAIIVDNRLIIAPIIRERIPDGNIVIAGNFKVEQANDLANAIKSSRRK